MTELVALRLPARLMRFVEKLASEQNTTVSQALRSLIEQRMRERMQDLRGWSDFATRALGTRTRARGRR
jgi:hypothetical protein